MSEKIIVALTLIVLASIGHAECRTNTPALTYTGTAPSYDSWTKINLSGISDFLTGGNIKSDTNSIYWNGLPDEENVTEPILNVYTPSGKKNYTIDIYDQLTNFGCFCEEGSTDYLNWTNSYCNDVPGKLKLTSSVDLTLSLENFTLNNYLSNICFLYENATKINISDVGGIDGNLSFFTSCNEQGVYDTSGVCKFRFPVSEIKRFNISSDEYNCFTIATYTPPEVEYKYIEGVRRAFAGYDTRLQNITFYVPVIFSDTYSNIFYLNDFTGNFYDGYLELSTDILNVSTIVNREKWTPSEVYYIDYVSLDGGIWYRPRVVSDDYSMAFDYFQVPYSNSSRNIVARKVYPEVDKGEWQNMHEAILNYFNYTSQRIYLFYNASNVDTAYFQVYVNNTLNYSDTLNTDSGLFSYTPPIDDYYYVITANLTFTDTRQIDFINTLHYYNNTGMLNTPPFTEFMGYSRSDFINGLVFVLVVIIAAIMGVNNYDVGAFLIAGIISVVSYWNWGTYPAIIITSLWIMALLGRLVASKEAYT